MAEYNGDEELMDKVFEGSETMHWTGYTFKDLPLERVKYIMSKPRGGRNSRLAVLSEKIKNVPVFGGMGIGPFPSIKKVDQARVTLHDAAIRCGWQKDANGDTVPKARMYSTVTAKYADGYYLEFVRLQPSKNGHF